MPWLPLRRCGLHARALGRHFGSSPLRTSLRERPGMEALTSADRARSDATAAFLAAVQTVRPANLIKKAVRLDGNVLSVKGRECILKRPCHVVGFGKAVFEMALEVEKILGESMGTAVVSVPVGTTQTHPIPPHSRIQVLEGALNNLPDEMSEKNAAKILEIAQNLEEDDTLLVLISGGGSALLSLPLPSVTLQDKLQVIKQLANGGADILELNCVRKRLSSVKGGRLAVAAQPATVVSLILSDVIGDPIDFIASGPTASNTDHPTAAWDIVCRYNLQQSIPKSAQLCLISKDVNQVKLEDSQVQNILVGNNLDAINAAVEKMKSLDHSVCVLSQRMEGSVDEVAVFYTQLARQICELIFTGNKSLSQGISFGQTLYPGTESEIIRIVNDSTVNKRGISLIAGGETTVKVTGRGIGGRNQELALRFADKSRRLARQYDYMNHFTVSLLSAGTDGIDGPTNAAGAFGYAEQLAEGEAHCKYLAENDSHSFYAKFNNGKDLIVTGHTGTNVMDIHVLTILRCHQ